MRVMLAKLLLEKPSCLMLDEPTNHLDLPSIEWVENYLRNYDGAVVVVSHDRTFLNNVISKTVEVTNSELVTYEGNYSYYLKEKDMREEIQQGAFDNQQSKIRQTERFIERFRAKATKSKLEPNAMFGRAWIAEGRLKFFPYTAIYNRAVVSKEHGTRRVNEVHLSLESMKNVSVTDE